MHTPSLFARMTKGLVALGTMIWITGYATGGTVYYVDVNDGNDEVNTGTSQSDPFQTIVHASNQAVPGDTVRVNHGVYKERIDIPSSGSPDSPITYEGVGDVVIDGENLRSYGFFVNTHQWITIRNFAMRDTRSHAVYVHGDNNTISNCEFINCGTTDSTYAVYLNSDADFCTVSYSVFQNAAYGLGINQGSRNVINRNTVAGVTQNGIYYQNNGSTTRQTIITNNLVTGCGAEGIQVDNVNFTSDIVVRNNVFGNGNNWRINNSNSSSFGDNLNVDPLFEPGTFFLSASSPLIEAGAVDESTGQLSTIGAYGVGNISSNNTTWNGWIDEIDRPLTISTFVEIDVAGKIRLEPGVNVATIRSPVIFSTTQAVVRSVRLDAEQAPFLPTGEKQVIDYDNTTDEPEIRYRTSDDSFTESSPTPIWVVAHPNERLNGVGNYLQVELVLRNDGK